MAIAYGWQILDGLEAAHAAGVWHRDLKPSNVLQLKESTQVEGVSYPLLKIVDFGIAHDSAPLAESVAQQIHAGTPDYLSPEQAARGSSDGRSDLYSLGVMLFEMLSGHMPFEGTAVEILRKHRFEAPPKLSRLVGSLPDGLDPLIDQLLEKDPAQRPATATEVKRELWRMLKLLHGERTNLAAAPKAPVSTRKAQTERVPRSPLPQEVVAQAAPVAGPARRGRLGYLVGAGLLLLVGAGLTVAFWPAPARPPPPRAEPPPPPAVAIQAPDPTVQSPAEEPPMDPVQDLEPLLPLPNSGGAPAPKKRVPVRRPTAAPAAPVACVPDGAWKAARGNDLQDLTKLAAQNGHMDEFERVEPELGRKVREAAGPADCAAVGRQIDGLIKRYHTRR
jgi:serine/threonine-protein kinase